MWPESSEQQQPLRTGLTTGTCATACCVAAAHLLLGQASNTRVSVTLPATRKGQEHKIVELDIFNLEHADQLAHAATIKDAGDDPDVTHGATVWVNLGLTTQTGIQFRAGPGVGTVTRAGLMLDIGEPAINPVPRQMIHTNLQALAQQYDYAGGFEVQIGINNGEQLALKTMNGRLGILGGLSVLGTSGIVRPFSCSAWIASIHQGLDVALANGCDHVAAATGNASEAYVQQRYQLQEMQLIEMGDFAGAVLKHLKKSPIAKLSVCAGFGKLTKLANGHMDLHSSRSSIDFDQLASLAAKLGASHQLQTQIRQANTALQALQLCQADHIDLVSAVCQAALQQAQAVAPANVAIEVIAVDRQGQWLGQAA
ncbi:MAG TPA: cobalt-precorrin-5B (C(1))-methyltransferase [Oceanospirillaceae bacterium]|nr:cobalt-precorrin-5B (C(1))-methyltransferase [Oceanospirillaceae bacterium]